MMPYIKVEVIHKHYFDGKEFRKFREETLKLSLRKCAAKLRVNPTYLSRIEIQEKNEKISQSFFERLSRL